MDLLKGAIATPFKGYKINTHAKLKDILELKPIQINRDHLRRVKKMTKIFEMDLRCQKVFTIAHIPVEIEFVEYGITRTIEPGFYVLDGNTRCEHHRKNPSAAPPEVIAFIMTIKNKDELENEYNGYDAQEAVENKPQKIQGAIRVLGLSGKLHGKALNGGYGMALDKAYPHDNKDTLLKKVAFFGEEIVTMSKANIFEITDKYFKNAQFYSACLMFARKNSARMDDVYKLFRDISRMVANYNVGAFHKLSDMGKSKKNGLGIMLGQRHDFNEKWFTFDTITNERFPKPISFFLFCLSSEMAFKSYDSSVLKPSLWYTKKSNLYDTELESLSTQFPQ